MEGIIKLILEDGIWAVVVGLLTSILIGIVKTPIRKRAICRCDDPVIRGNRENVFDTLVFLSTFVFAFLGAMSYYMIINRAFYLMPILDLGLTVWLSQSLIYGIWKKLGLKRFLQIIPKIFVKDVDNDGKITLKDAIKQVKYAYKHGKLDVEKLVAVAIENATENAEDVLKVASDGIEITESMAAVVEAKNGDPEALVEEVKESVNVVAKGSIVAF